jgi:hypothetical protein
MCPVGSKETLASIHHTLVPTTLPYQPVEMLNAFHFGSPVLAAVPARVPPGGASAAAPAAKGSSSNEADKGKPKAKGKGDAVDGSTKDGANLVPGFLLAGGGGKHSGVANGLVRTGSRGACMGFCACRDVQRIGVRAAVALGLREGTGESVGIVLGLGVCVHCPASWQHALWQRALCPQSSGSHYMVHASLFRREKEGVGGGGGR